MHLYLPIAELSANALHLVLLGGVAGLLSGMFGIGGGFILTPMLIFIGIPPAVSVATATNMIVASSFSGFLSHLKHKRVDITMGNCLIAGGLLGASLGVWLFSRLQKVGQIDLMITLLYISLLVTISVVMLREARQILAAKKAGHEHHVVTALALPAWVKALPWQMEFKRSDVRHSALLPIAIGLLSGLLVGLLGIGGGLHYAAADAVCAAHAYQRHGGYVAVPNHLHYDRSHLVACTYYPRGRYCARGPTAHGLGRWGTVRRAAEP
jgi:uncharacterized protein